MWGRLTHCGRGGYTSGALHLCKRIAHVENGEVLGCYSAMIARHDGGKSAPIVAASHAFFFPQNKAAAHALVKLRKAPLPRNGHLNVETGEVLAICW